MKKQRMMDIELNSTCRTVRKSLKAYLSYGELRIHSSIRVGAIDTPSRLCPRKRVSVDLELRFKTSRSGMSL
jgi:hypothetical protein